MNINQIARAKKYASAFLNVFGDQFTESDYHAMAQAAERMKKDRNYLLLLSMPLVPNNIKLSGIQKIVASLHLHESYDRLFRLLIEERKLLLLGPIFDQLARAYRHKHNMMLFTIASSQELDESEKKSIAEFLKNKTNKRILYNTKTDADLIAGLRLQSKTLLWEHSIEKQLRSIRLSLGE